MILPADILDFCKTKDDANEFQTDLLQVSEALFNNKDFEDTVREQLSYAKKEKLLAQCKKQPIDTKNITQVQNFLLEIKNTLQQMPIVTVTVAFAPKEPLVVHLSTWLYLHTKKPMLLDIQVNTTIIGGAIVMYNGMYLDYSLKKILEEKYQKGDLRL